MALKLGEVKTPGRVNRLGLSLSPMIDKHCKQQNIARVQRDGFYKSEHRTMFGVIEIETNLSTGATSIDLRVKEAV